MEGGGAAAGMHADMPQSVHGRPPTCEELLPGEVVGSGSSGPATATRVAPARGPRSSSSKHY